MPPYLEGLLERGSCAGRAFEEAIPQVRGYVWGLASILVPWTASSWKGWYRQEHNRSYMRYLRALDGADDRANDRTNDRTNEGSGIDGEIELEASISYFKQNQLEEKGYEYGINLARGGAVVGSFACSMYYSLNQSQALWDQMIGAGLLWTCATITDYVYQGIHQGFENLGSPQQR